MKVATETGRVVGIDDDALWVETIRRSTCNSCTVRNGCGQGLLNRFGDGRRHHLRVLLGEHTADAFALDDEVEISVPEQVLVRGALIVYLLPLVTLVAGLAVADQLMFGEGGAALFAAAGFAAGLLLVRLHAWRIRDKPEYQPVVAGRSGDGAQVPASAVPGRQP